MNFEITPFAIASLVAAVLALLMVWIAYPRRTQIGGTPLTALMISAAVWCFFTGLEYATVGVSAKVFWAKLEYVGMLTTPVFFLSLAIEHHDSVRWLTWRKLGVMLLVPALAQLLTLTNEWHNLIWVSFTPSSVGQNLLVYEYGIGFWVSILGYSYILMLIGTLLLIHAAVIYPRHYRSQTIALIVGAIVPWTGSFFDALGFAPYPGYDLAPTLVVVTGVFFAWGIFRYRLLDLSPVARRTIIESLRDPLFVLDPQDRVTDLNHAASRLLSLSSENVIGFSFALLLPNAQTLVDLLRDPAKTEIETTLTLGNETRDYQVGLSFLTNARGNPIGRAMVLRDMTERKRAGEALRQAQLALGKAEEREHLARELHDNLGQMVSAMMLQTQATQLYLNEGNVAQAEAQLTQLNEIHQDAYVQLRNYIAELKSAQSIERRLIPSLTKIVAQFERNYSLRVDLEIATGIVERGFTAEVGTHLLGIICEALANIAKHAEAKQVWLVLTAQGDQAQLTIKDDGCGFDPEHKVDTTIHFGLQNMRERARQVDGSLEIHSILGQGTQIRVRVPLAAMVKERRDEDINR